MVGGALLLLLLLRPASPLSLPRVRMVGGALLLLLRPASPLSPPRVRMYLERFGYIRKDDTRISLSSWDS